MIGDSTMDDETVQSGLERIRAALPREVRRVKYRGQSYYLRACPGYLLPVLDKLAAAGSAMAKEKTGSAECEAAIAEYGIQAGLLVAACWCDADGALMIPEPDNKSRPGDVVPDSLRAQGLAEIGNASYEWRQAMVDAISDESESEVRPEGEPIPALT